MDPTVRVCRLDHGSGLSLPSYGSPGAAGADLRAAVGEPLEMGPLARAAVPTGLAIELPAGYEAQVRPRSGLALNQGLTVANAPGTIDSDYRGEVKVLMVNLGTDPVTINRGDRIAQLVVAPVTQVAFSEVAELSASTRGSGGFGSTGR